MNDTFFLTFCSTSILVPLSMDTRRPVQNFESAYMPLLYYTLIFLRAKLLGAMCTVQAITIIAEEIICFKFLIGNCMIRKTKPRLLIIDSVWGAFGKDSSYFYHRGRRIGLYWVEIWVLVISASRILLNQVRIYQSQLIIANPPTCTPSVPQSKSKPILPVRRQKNTKPAILCEVIACMYFWFPLQWQLCLCCSTALVVTKAFAFKYKGKKERLKNMVNIITIIAALNSSALKLCCGSISAIIATQGNQRKRVWAKKPLKLYLDQSQHSDCKTNYFPFVCVFWKKNWSGTHALVPSRPTRVSHPALIFGMKWCRSKNVFKMTMVYVYCSYYI